MFAVLGLVLTLSDAKSAAYATDAVVCGRDEMGRRGVAQGRTLGVAAVAAVTIRPNPWSFSPPNLRGLLR